MSTTTHPLPPPSPKKPSTKKRHTKPCRYYQTGTCPHAEQEDCDFAHVISDGVPLPVPKQCRFYLQGNCTNGIWCQYLHGDAAPLELSLIKEPPIVSGRGFRGFPPASPTVYIPSSPVLYAPWSPYSDSFHSPLEFTPPAHLLPKSDCFSPESLDPETPAPSPTLSEPDPENEHEVYLPGEDASSRHRHSNYFALQQQPYVHAAYAADDMSLGTFSPPPPMSPFLGFTPAARLQLSVVRPPPVSPPASPPYGIAASPQLYDIFSPKSAGFPASALSAPPPPHSHRQRAPNYRTKPCKFFKPGSVCPSGDECTFIHALPKDKPATEDASSPDLPSPEHGLPAKPLSKKEDNARKGFFPISWRVIGGGVRLSGSSTATSSSGREFSDICDFYSDVESEYEPVQEVEADADLVDADPAAVADDSESDLNKSASALTPASAPAASLAFPESAQDPDSASSEDDASTSESSGTTPTSRRKRASSIPSALMASHVDVLRLFSAAESPGGL